MWRGFQWVPYHVVLTPFKPFYAWSWLEPLVAKYFDWWMAAYPFGQPTVFRSRTMNPLVNPWIMQWFAPREPDQLGYYDTSPLRDTLNKYVDDWQRIKRDGGMKLSLGATDLETAELRFFNSFVPQTTSLAPPVEISADHVLASAAIPPYPAIGILDESGRKRWYWDGGLVSNTPLMDLQDELREGHDKTFVFDVHIFERKGPAPRSADEVIWRQKAIQFGSRKRQAFEIVARHEAEMQRKEPKTGPTTGTPLLEVCQIMYERDRKSPEFWFIDGDLSEAAYEELFKQGRCDTYKAFEEARVMFDGAYGKLYRIGSCGKGETPEPKVQY
jgi:predicted acylesterase/phospholipase RssA